MRRVELERTCGRADNVGRMATCFCGCSRKVRVRGRIANVHGGNTKRLVDELDAMLQAELFTDTSGEVRLRALVSEGATQAAAYQAAVHGDRPLESIDHDAWVRWRDQATALLADPQSVVSSHDERTRIASVGDGIDRHGLADDEGAGLSKITGAEVEDIRADRKPARRLAKNRPFPVLLSNGDILAPVESATGWDVVRIVPEGAEYVGWLVECQEREVQRGMALELVVSLIIPPLSTLFAIVRFARAQVGPGLALLLTGFVGTQLWAIVIFIILYAQNGSVNGITG